MTNVEKVKAGELAIKNDNNDVLERLITLLWPKGTIGVKNHLRYEELYFTDKESLDSWYCNPRNERGFHKNFILATELLKEIEPPVFSPKRGDYVMVSDDSVNWHKVIYLLTIDGAENKIVTVSNLDTTEFLEGDKFKALNYRHMKPIERTKLTKAEIANRLGLDINEFDIEL